VVLFADSGGFKMARPKYDVAISFLSADEPTAAGLSNALNEGLEVFFYPRKQEELAGKDGLEAMRTPFLDDSRIVVVLYREPWGETPWTRVEQTAIQESCLKHGWQRLFFVMLDKKSAPPKWLPTTHIRFNYADFGLEQAIGAIKARVQEVGGTIAPLTALKRAELSRVETQYLIERKQLRSPFGPGRDRVATEALNLFTKITGICAEIHASGSAPIQAASDIRRCHLRNRVSLVVTLDLSSEADLVVREFDKKCPMGGENLVYLNGQPQMLREIRFLPDMTRAREYGWSEEGQPSKFLSSAALADRIVGLFIDLAARDDRGEFEGAASFSNLRRGRRR
jgi:hypothetical protein